MSATFCGRIEDERLVTGKGTYSSDLNLPRQAYGAFLRSPFAHATLERVDTAAARALPGMLCVLTGEDLAALGYGRMPQYMADLKNADGTPLVAPDWPPLATGRVRFVGEPIALVVAESLNLAVDAAEAIEVGYNELPCAVATSREPAPPIWPHAPNNIAFDFRAGDRAATDEAFSRAAHVVCARVASQRLVVNPMEPRALVAAYDALADRYELHAGSQGAAGLRDQIAGMMRLPKERIRVISRDVGGGFGCKTHAYPEYVAALEASKRLGRPVKWTASRSESFLSDTQGRDNVISGELALDSEGHFLAVRAHSIANLGAYQTSHSAFTATANILRCLPSVYRTGAIDVHIECIYTNTVPVAPYRGAGRPEANLLMERLVEVAAEKLGLERTELRRRNLIPASAMPYRAPNGCTYDSGEFEAALERALELADYGSFPQRRETSRQRGSLRGIGVACYLEIAGGTPFENMRLDLDAAGAVTVRSGLHSNGQGHATVFRRLVAGALGIDPARVSLAESDTALLPDGTGSIGSRSLTVGAAAVAVAAKSLIDVARARAAELLEVSPSDIGYAAGVLCVAGTDRCMKLEDLARRSGGFHVIERGQAQATFPNGCHVAEVEIDPETGVARFESHVAVDDVGMCADGTLVEGQVHGGVAQGLGQVLLEQARFDPLSGQLLTGSFMDYALPRADDLPEYISEFREIRCRTNAFGAKGAGEAGTTGALAAGYNAVMDALRSAGVTAFDMPATPERVWQALQSAKGAGG